MRIPAADIAQLDQPIATRVLTAVIDGTERVLDLTSWGPNYPFRVELEARDEGCYCLQGGSTVALAGANPQIKRGEWRVLTVKSAAYAYVAIQRSGTGTGTVVATLIGETT